mgnify:FL=1
MLLLGLCQRNEYTIDLFAPQQPVRVDRLMRVLDQINNKWGRDTLHPATVQPNPGWSMRREMVSPAYTTKVSELLVVSAR